MSAVVVGEYLVKHGNLPNYEWSLKVSFCQQLWDSNYFLYRDNVVATRIKRFAKDNFVFGKKAATPLDIAGEVGEVPATFSGKLIDVAVSAYFCFVCHAICESSTTRLVHLRT